MGDTQETVVEKEQEVQQVSITDEEVYTADEISIDEKDTKTRKSRWATKKPKKKPEVKQATITTEDIVGDSLQDIAEDKTKKKKAKAIRDLSESRVSQKSEVVPEASVTEFKDKIPGEQAKVR